jgi:predicted nucleotidyltransferase
VIELRHVLSVISRQLDAQHAGWALVGGLAVSVRTTPRFTQDIDLAVAVSSDRDAERLTADLGHYGFQLESVVEQEATGRLAVATLSGSSEDDAPVDLLFAMSGIELEVVAGAELLEVLPGLSLPVASPGHLIALKVLARDDATRPQDLVDLQMLLTAANVDDLATATASLGLIRDRGYDRGKDLLAELELLRTKFGLRH